MESIESLLVIDTPAPHAAPIIEENVCQPDSELKEAFDPNKHLTFTPPDSIITMEEIGFRPDTGVSPVAVSQPFPLFSAEAVMRMRSEIFSADVMQNCQYKSNLAAFQLRGYVNKYAPFIRDCWQSEELLSIISKIAGIDLVPQMDFEIGHINISMKSAEQIRAEKEMVEKKTRMHADDEGVAGCPWEDDTPVVGWHTDSYPFVCILMLSDCTDMVGGETALRTANGTILKVRGPQMGSAIVLQGRYILHQALRALGTAERITMVTSFRPRNFLAKDDSVLTTVRPISDLSELYYGFGEYRLEMMGKRIRAKLEEVRDRRKAGAKFSTDAFKTFLQEQTEFFAHTNREIVEDENVSVGYIEEAALPEIKVA